MWPALARRIVADDPAIETVDAHAKLALVESLTRLFEGQHAGPPPACLGPMLPGATLVGGARVPGTSLELEPAQAAWCIGWLTGHAALGALLPVCDYLARRAVLTGLRPAKVAVLLHAMAQVHRLAPALPWPHASQSLRVATAGVAARLLGAADAEVAAALALAYGEGVPLHPAGSPLACAALAASSVRAALQGRAGVPAGDEGPVGIELPEVSVMREPPEIPDAFGVWHRFDEAVRRRYPVKAADRLLATLHADTPFETMPLQSFVALLVRAS